MSVRAREPGEGFTGVCVCVHVGVHVALYVCVRVAVSVLWLCLCDEGVSVQRVSVYLGMSARLRGRDCVLHEFFV